MFFRIFSGGQRPSSPCLKVKTGGTGNVLTLQSNYGDGNSEDAREARGLVVRRRVTHSTRSSLLQAAQRSSRQRQVRPVLRNQLRRFLSQHARTSIPASRPIF